MKIKPLISLIVTFCWCACAEEPPVAIYDVHVIDEGGKSLDGISVEGLFSWMDKSYNHIRQTDRNGNVTFESVSDIYSGVSCESDNFYTSVLRVEYGGLKNGRWVLRNSPPVLIMRRITDPVPLYAVENWRIEMPKIGTAAFDLEKRAWVKPLGSGVTPDLIFTLQRQVAHDKGEATLKLSFSNSGDGLIPIPNFHPGGSRLRFPREAPESGYQPQQQWHWRWAVGESEEALVEGERLWDEHRKRIAKIAPPAGYFLRVRTELSKKGEVVSARYARLVCAANPHRPIMGRGDFMWDPDDSTQTAKIELTYYFNPTGSRNLEFDLQKNLFKDLPDENKPRWP